MAKAKKRKSSRKVGAFAPGGLMMKVAAIVAGYLLVADPLNKELDKIFKKDPAAPPPPATTAGFLDNIDIVGVGEAGVGALLLFMGKPSLLKTVAGGVLLGAGVKKLTEKAGAVNGYQAVPVIGNRKRVGGYQAVPVIGNTPAQLQGVPAQLQGYRVNGYTQNGSGVLGRVGSSEIRDTAGSGIAVGSNAGYMR